MIPHYKESIPQCDNTDYEGHYQSLLYTIFSLLGMYIDVEVRTPRGRAEGFALCGLPVVKVGINFDSEQHTIEDWTIN